MIAGTREKTSVRQSEPASRETLLLRRYQGHAKLHTPHRLTIKFVRTIIGKRVQRWDRGGARNSLQTSFPPLSPGRRCGATAQSALGWYRPSVGVPETLDGRPSGVLV